MRGAGSAGPHNINGLTLLLGGARSGKSTAAVELATRWEGPVVIIATAEARDDEMAARIERHKSARPEAWTTVEEPIDLEGALEGVEVDACVVIDCLTLWVSNLMERGLSDDRIEERGRKAAALAAARSSPTIVVTNEVGWGIVPMNEMARRFRDVLGEVNKAWAEVSTTALLMVAGKALNLEDPR